MTSGRGRQSLWMVVAGAACAGGAGLMLVLGAMDRGTDGGATEAASDGQVMPDQAVLAESPSPPGPFVVPRLEAIVAAELNFPLGEANPPGPLLTDDARSREVISRVLRLLETAEVQGESGEVFQYQMKLVLLRFRLRDGTWFTLHEAHDCARLSATTIYCPPVPDAIGAFGSGSRASVRLRSPELALFLSYKTLREAFNVAPPRCAADDISIALTGDSGTRDRMLVSFGLTNTSLQDCSLPGGASFTFYDEAGNRLPFGQRSDAAQLLRQGDASPLLLSPGERAFVAFEKFRCDGEAVAIGHTVGVHVTADVAREVMFALPDYPGEKSCPSTESSHIVATSPVAGSLEELLAP